MFMTPKASRHQASGRLLVHPGPKKSDRWDRMSKQCWSVSSTFKELCTGNSFPGVRRSTRSFTWGFWNDWGRECGGQGRNCGDRANGSFTMTTLLHTRRCEFVNFLPLRAWHLCPIPPTHLTWPCWLFFVSPNEKGLERALIWHCGGSYRNFDKSAGQHPSWGVPEMFRTVETEIG